MAVEFGIVLPVALLFLLGVMESGRALWTYVTLARATQAAARCGAINSTLCGTPARIADYAVTQAYGLQPPESVFSSRVTTCGLEVTANLPFTLLIPWIGDAAPDGEPNNFSLHSTACYPL